jgi:hypothetical protein
MEPKKIGKQFQYAAKAGIRFVVLAGEDELARGVVAVKDLLREQQFEVSATSWPAPCRWSWSSQGDGVKRAAAGVLTVLLLAGCQSDPVLRSDRLGPAQYRLQVDRCHVIDRARQDLRPWPRGRARRVPAVAGTACRRMPRRGAAGEVLPARACGAGAASELPLPAPCKLVGAAGHPVRFPLKTDPHEPRFDALRKNALMY